MAQRVSDSDLTARAHPYGDDELKARVTAIQDRHFALMTRAGTAAVDMIDAIVAVRKPYDEKNRPAAVAKAKATLDAKEAFQKAIRSLENGRSGLGFAKDFNRKSLPELLDLLVEPSSERQWILYEAIRKGADLQKLHERPHIKRWFLEQMKELVALEERILTHKGGLPPDDLLRQAKADGFEVREPADAVRAATVHHALQRLTELTS